jgi:hypothetical protein
MGEQRCVLGDAVGREPFDGVYDMCVESPSPFVEEASVCNLVNQGMLERVFEVREQLRLVEKFGRLKVA